MFNKKLIVSVLSFVFGFVATNSVAFASSMSLETVLCNAYSLFNGQWGRIFALFALVALGISFFLGKISWGTVISVALGIGVIFGGTSIVSALTGGSGSGALCASSGTTA